METIYKRRSNRHFVKNGLEKSVLDKILLAGMQAPSPKNDQPWHFLVICEEEQKKYVAEILERQLRILQEENTLLGNSRPDITAAFETARVLKEASAIVFVYLETGVYEIHDDHVKWELNARDVECTHLMAIGAAIQNMLLEATENGIDSLWIGDFFYAYNQLKKYLGQEGCMMAAVALGYGDEGEYKTTRKSLNETVSWF